MVRLLVLGAWGCGLSMSPLAAFGAGAGFMTLSVKFLVFTLGAISAITDAHLGVELSVFTFVLFVALAQSVPFAILAVGSSSSARSAAILEGFRAWLQRNNRVITIVFGLVFGTWFVLKALAIGPCLRHAQHWRRAKPRRWRSR